VDVDRVIDSLVERKLTDDDVVEIASREALAWLNERGIAREIVEGIVATLDESGPMTIRALRERIVGQALDTGSEAPSGTEDEGRRLFDRLVLRLLNYHVLTFLG
jgi:hypothetical protein